MIEQASDQLRSTELADHTKRRIGIAGIVIFITAIAVVNPVTAQNVGDSSAICQSGLYDFAQGVVGTIFRIGPLLGLASGSLSMVMMSQSTSKDKKKRWKQRRNDSFIYGVVGVLLSGYIVEFLFSLTGQSRSGECQVDFTTLAINHVDGAMTVVGSFPF